MSPTHMETQMKLIEETVPVFEEDDYIIILVLILPQYGVMHFRTARMGEIVPKNWCKQRIYSPRNEKLWNNDLSANSSLHRSSWLSFCRHEPSRTLYVWKKQPVLKFHNGPNTSVALWMNWNHYRFSPDSLKICNDLGFLPLRIFIYGVREREHILNVLTKPVVVD